MTDNGGLPPEFGPIEIPVMPCPHDRLIADVAEWAGYDAEPVAQAIADSFGWPYQPQASYGIIIRFQWWERPRRLWRRKATDRTARELGFLR